MEKPNLIENKIKQNLNYNLKNIRIFKDKYITLFINLFLFILLIIIIGGFLSYKYKGKLSPEELLKKENDKKIYLFTKLKQFSINKQKQQQKLITNLPIY